MNYRQVTEYIEMITEYYEVNDMKDELKQFNDELILTENKPSKLEELVLRHGREILREFII